MLNFLKEDANSFTGPASAPSVEEKMLKIVASVTYNLTPPLE